MLENLGLPIFIARFCQCYWVRFSTFYEDRDTFVFLEQIHIGFFTFEFTQRIIGCGRFCFILLGICIKLDDNTVLNFSAA